MSKTERFLGACAFAAALALSGPAPAQDAASIEVGETVTIANPSLVVLCSDSHDVNTVYMAGELTRRQAYDQEHRINGRSDNDAMVKAFTAQH
jgi:hypothetical protein